MALEDSPNGVRAAVGAGMNVIAVATLFTITGIHSSEVLEHAWVVHEPGDCRICLDSASKSTTG